MYPCSINKSLIDISTSEWQFRRKQRHFILPRGFSKVNHKKLVAAVQSTYIDTYTHHSHAISMLQRRQMSGNIPYTYGWTIEPVEGLSIHLDTGTKW
jgi:hypothetical protein